MLAVLAPAPATEQTLLAALAPLQLRLTKHPLYAAVRTLPALRLFMQSHVYAVWDFMSLLKGLQRSLTCVEVPWRPTSDAPSRRLINEIVLGEESDLYEGEAISHFELYLRAMRQSGAETGAVEVLLGSELSVESALAPAPEEAAAFVRATFQVLAAGEAHRIAAAFTFGREDLIPQMFSAMVRELDAREPGQVSLYRYYLDRHIELDGDEHGPMALRMVRNLCRTPKQWEEAIDAARCALEARLALWDGIHARIARRAAQLTRAGSLQDTSLV